MGPIIQIVGQVFSRVLIAIVAWSFTFVGQSFDAKLNQASSTSPKLNISPIFVNIEERNVDVAKNKIETTNTISKKETPPPAPISIPTPIPIPTPAPTPTPAPAPETKAKQAPSLENLPVPSIELPQITDEINRGIALGEWSNVYNNSKQSIINIFCVSTKGNMVSISTGSGVIIDEKGIILTNAHVAENYLIPNRDCVIRQGEIAMDKYKASLVYINENWLKKNASVLFSQSARGTGENDFALLSINSKSDGTNVSEEIPHTNINMEALTEQSPGNKILVAGYPAGTLGALSLRKYLNFVADVINITNVYTLDGNSVDVFETDISRVGQHGSSGGGIFNASNNLIGLIVSVNDESGNSKINALTTTYISRTINNETGKSLAEFIDTDKNLLISSFLLKQNSLYEYVRPFVTQ
ncbi:MAG: trypsin-like peptidase domain-containing protein [bacterium]